MYNYNPYCTRGAFITKATFAGAAVKFNPFISRMAIAPDGKAKRLVAKTIGIVTHNGMNE